MEIFPVIIILITTAFTRMITKSWLSPGSFFSAFWSFFLIVPLIFASNYNIDYLGLWFIAIFTMSLAAGSVIAYQPNQISTENISNFEINTNYQLLYFVLIILTFIILLGLYLLLRYVTNIYISNKNWDALEEISKVLSIPTNIGYFKSCHNHIPRKIATFLLNCL